MKNTEEYAVSVYEGKKPFKWYFLRISTPLWRLSNLAVHDVRTLLAPAAAGVVGSITPQAWHD